MIPVDIRPIYLRLEYKIKIRNVTVRAYFLHRLSLLTRSEECASCEMLRPLSTKYRLRSPFNTLFILILSIQQPALLVNIAKTFDKEFISIFRKL